MVWCFGVVCECDVLYVVGRYGKENLICLNNFRMIEVMVNVVENFGKFECCVMIFLLKDIV